MSEVDNTKNLYWNNAKTREFCDCHWEIVARGHLFRNIPCDAENVTRIKLQARYFCIAVYVPEQCYLCTIVFI